MVTRNTEMLPGGDDSQDIGHADSGEDVESRAKRMGWRPKDQFRGDPDLWVDAAEYVRRGEETMPLLRDNLRKTEAHNQKMAKQIAGFEAEMAAMRQQVEESRAITVRVSDMLDRAEINAQKREKAAYERAMAEIEQKMDKAVEEGDVQAARAARKELEQLNQARVTDPPKEPPPKPAATPPRREPSADDRAAAAWANATEQAWFRENEDAKSYAIGLSAKIARDPKTANLSTEENLKLVRQKAAEKFPEYFDPNDPIFEEADRGDDDQGAEPEPRRQAARVATPRSPSGGRSRQGGGNTFDDIPAEDKRVFERVLREQTAAGVKKPITKAQYAADYWGAEPSSGANRDRR